MPGCSQHKNKGRVPFDVSRSGCKSFAIFGKDCLANIGDWGTFRCWVGFGTKSNKQGDGKQAVFEKRLKHRKG